MTKINEKFCGNCCWFYAEDIYGFGICPYKFGDAAHCGDGCTTGEFISKQEMRHHMATLIQYNRYMKDTHYPPICKMPWQSELEKAIEFSVRYMKVFREL